jgi:hypothetical protein
MTIEPPEEGTQGGDGSAQGRRAPSSPRRTLLWCWVMLGFSVVTGVAVMVTSESLLAFSSCGGWSFAAAGLLLACAAVYGARRTDLDPANVPKRRWLWGSIMVALALLVGQTLQGIAVADRIDRMCLKEVTKASLRVLGQAVFIYAQDYGDYPPSLAYLVDTPGVGPKSLCAAADSAAYSRPWGTYTSFDYRPGSGSARRDRELVVAYEHSPWTPKDLRLAPAMGRWVVFADGRVEWLDQEGLANVLDVDRRRREGISWPTLTVPAGEFAQEAATPHEPTTAP